ncbi:MAG: SPASM domain-containing protein [Candidatus Aminicenantes bacterium]|nr:SPASM domain-containing protein [Candidatus Aminicenantes bacterium]
MRREFFGGLVYDPRTGTTLEVDKAAFHFLYLIKDRTTPIDELVKLLAQNNVIKGQGTSIIKTINQLIKLNIIEIKEGRSGAQALNYQRPSEIPKYSWLSAPETVHWAVTYHCEAGCPHCYTRRFPVLTNELNTPLALKLIEKVAQWGVFQLAIGGGEPFAREDLPDLVQYASAAGLSVHITTGKYHLEPRLLESIVGSVAALNIGLPAHILPDQRTGAGFRELIKKLQTTAALIQDAGVVPGVNLVLTKSIIPQLELILEQLMNIGISRVVLLRYKPPERIEQWNTENPTFQQMKQLHIKINDLLRQIPRLTIRVDCSMSFVQRHLPVSLAAKLGIKGCVAADRILAIAPDGSVYPCSQLVHPRCYSGNLLDYEPQVLWDQARNLHQYRLFRTKKPFKHSKCGICRVNTACGGCRVFAADAVGGDPGCPDPIIPELPQLGKTGRSLDFGYTSGGFPLATAEQIAEWIGLDSDLEGYPEWIKKDTKINKENILIKPKPKKKKPKRRKKK